MKWAVFDLEFTELLPDSKAQPWAPDVHIACASVMSSDDAFPRLFYEQSSTDASGVAASMSPASVDGFLQYLQALVGQGYRLVTWGGTASDWRMLHKESAAMKPMVKAMTLDSFDVPFSSCMSIGMMMSLTSAVSAYGYDLKGTDDSKHVPQLWAQPDGRQAVLYHVYNDSLATMYILQIILSTRKLAWITSRGTMRTWHDAELLRVSDGLQLPLPSVPFAIADNMNAQLQAQWLYVE